MNNNKPIFILGSLYQGYWPDGINTPPSEEAMIFNIQKMKDLGFNTIRKHAKNECFRYYYQCNKIGMLVGKICLLVMSMDQAHGTQDIWIKELILKERKNQKIIIIKN